MFHKMTSLNNPCLFAFRLLHSIYSVLEWYAGRQSGINEGGMGNHIK